MVYHSGKQQAAQEDSVTAEQPQKPSTHNLLHWLWVVTNFTRVGGKWLFVTVGPDAQSESDGLAREKQATYTLWDVSMMIDRMLIVWCM